MNVILNAYNIPTVPPAAVGLAGFASGRGSGRFGSTFFLGCAGTTGLISDAMNDDDVTTSETIID